MTSPNSAESRPPRPPARKPGLVIAGALMLLVGGVWFMQGLGSLAGSPMTGVIFWSWAGGALALVGLVFLVRGLRSGRA
ncbi:MAG: hypothetical protein F2842_02585 [Actinobacteria bacterium]|uniref:Unannotated protein n=1 Tax=freshwater metagenome TaxID=449393 RepID=A0A6J7IYI5_9ZZZZ|nr:hypothetical protein [Actinomycetota bacterium]